MTPNHGYNTPTEGTLDWHLPLNDNFDRLERDVPVVDVESNLDTYVPHTGTLFFATDTGRRFVGDGENWSELPYPDGTTSNDSGSSSDDGSSTDSTANVVVSISSGTASAARDGSEFASGDADSVFDSVMNGLRSGDHVLIESGTYEINTLKQTNGLTDITWESKGEVYLDDKGTPQNRMFGFWNCDGVLITGGTYDYDQPNNVDDGKPGTQSILNVKYSTNIEIEDTTLLNAEDMFVGGNNATYVNIHHNEMRKSGERGVYISEDAHDIEVHHNVIRGVDSGALRSNEAPTGWYIHDNDIVMEPNDYGVVYLFGTGASDIRIENDTGKISASGEILHCKNTDSNGNPNRNITITGGYYEGNPEKQNYQRFSVLEESDLSTISVSAETEIVNLPINNPEIHE
ncbi:hypothetical protein C2R22_15435 [Salinigranum rubrum]|uniref:Right handed beta helix domain-containing protein n=1 Tax=Salinigranum rubrum TaxID=755307 RepID=A0A2I8VP17_9EURY|nr:hypothetical protein [Salinigranum rubrum]AUV82859.1 hypothetical protein C2R22_15435 [Salinigranum rubrum]